MIHIAVRSEYSFNSFAPINEVSKIPGTAIGIADDDSTFGHYKHYKLCKENGVKPLLGVRLMVTMLKKHKEKNWGPRYTFIAKNNDGLREIYSLVKKAFDNFYYHPFIEMMDVIEISENIIVIAEDFVVEDRIDYVGISPITSSRALAFAESEGMKTVAMSCNLYLTPDDREIYQLLTGDKSNDQTYPQYLLPEDHHLALFHDESAIANTFEVADQCDVEFIPSDMIRYKGGDNIEDICHKGAHEKGIDLTDSVYGERYKYELDLIKTKDYGDYFLIVADMVKFSKKTMLVGPSRGSSAGSLVCYLMGITEVDPIKYGLLFERFIDLNRADLPDIDVDFPDVKRDKVIKYLAKTYGEKKVAHIATVAKLKPKSAISLFAKNLSVPISATEEVKNSIIERSGGDARAQMRIADTFNTTEVGSEFIEMYPTMRLVEKVEGHASHTGTHAAGIIVCNDELTEYASVNTRDNVMMMDKNEAEGLNLLKIDCLGLRTLSILEEVANRVGMKFSDYYTLPLDDENVFKVFNEMRLFGVFQFEGYALQSVTREMGCNNFDDIAAITALARPGPIHSGGTSLYVKRKTGQEDVEYLADHPAFVKATEETLGIIIYQEQLMIIAKEYGDMTWFEVSMLRKTASKSLGEEYFNKYKESFMAGAKRNGRSELESENVWLNMMTFGSWGFNKSHAVSYAMVSYWTAWAKAYYPLEFAAANMNNARSEDSAIKILRELVRHDGVDYVSIDPDNSTEKWDIAETGDVDENGDPVRKLVGGLMNIKGIGIKKAQDIMKRREEGNPTKNQVSKLLNPNTPFDILFPARHHWGFIYDDPSAVGLDRKIDVIEDIRGEGKYLFIAKLVDRNLRDLNEYQSVVKRDGKIIENDALFLNLTLEDDTESINCSIGRYRFEELGRKIAESGKVGHDWYLVSGSIKGQWRRIDIDNILNLWEWSKDNECE